MNTPGLNLTADKATACRRAYEEFVDGVALRGSAPKNMQGLINSSLVTATTAPADGGRERRHQLDALDAQDQRAGHPRHQQRADRHRDRHELAVLRRHCLASARRAGRHGRSHVPEPSDHVARLDQAVDVLTVQTGRPITLAGVRGLETAGVGGISRMVAYRRDPQVLKMSIPMRHKFLPVWQRGPLVFHVPGIFRIGGIEIRMPAAMRYLDGI